MSKRVGFLALMAAIGLTTALTPGLVGAQDVKIGLALPATGPFFPHGQDVERGFRIHIDDVGSQVAGRKITVIKEDTEGKPDVGLTKARKLVERDAVHLVTGIVSSAVGLAVKPYFDSKQTPLLLLISSADEITMKNRSPYVFRIIESSAQSIYPYGQWVARKLGYRKAIIVTSNYVTGHVQADAFARGFSEAGGQVVERIHPPLGTIDFGPFLTKIDPSKADMVFVFAPADIVRFFTQYAEYGLKGKLPVIGGGSQPDMVILPSVGKPALGTVVADNYAVDIDTPGNKHFVGLYRAKHGTPPSEWSYVGYAGALAIAEAVRLAGPNMTREGLKDALGKLDFMGPKGRIKFDENGQNIGQVYVTEVVEKDGRMTKRTLDAIPDLWQSPAYKKVFETK